jgi:hypothetical protein
MTGTLWNKWDSESWGSLTRFPGQLDLDKSLLDASHAVTRPRPGSDPVADE